LISKGAALSASLKLGGKKNNKDAALLASVKLGAKKNNEKHED
jgi:hypothetical protein